MLHQELNFIFKEKMNNGMVIHFQRIYICHKFQCFFFVRTEETCDRYILWERDGEGKPWRWVREALFNIFISILLIFEKSYPCITFLYVNRDSLGAGIIGAFVCFIPYYFLFWTNKDYFNTNLKNKSPTFWMETLGNQYGIVYYIVFQLITVYQGLTLLS